VSLDINFDGIPAQTSWDIVDANGNIVTSGGTYTGTMPNSNLAEALCLIDGCYDLVFYDSANDGMCPRRTTTVLTGINAANFGLGGVFNGLPRLATNSCGNYTLPDANGTVLASGGGRFGSSETSTFCLSGGVANRSQKYDYQIFTKNNNDVLLSPNPVDEILTITHNLHNDASAHVQIVDVNGRILYENFYEDNNPQILHINVDELPTGLYFVQLFSGNEMTVERFVKR